MATPPQVALSESLDAESIARAFGDAVWRVEVEGCDIESGGSSFAVGPNLVVTNRHVVEFNANPTKSTT